MVEFVSRDNHVGVLDDAEEVLVHGLAIDLLFEDASVDFVDDYNWLDFLGEGLPEDGLCLNTDALNIVHYDKCTISDTQGRCDLGREVNMAWRVDDVNQVRLLEALLDNISLEVK